MKFEKVKCLVRVNQSGNVNTLTVCRAGPDALSVTEIPILRLMNDIGMDGAEDCCISRAEVVGEFEETVANELQRLREKYKAIVVNTAYPGGRGMPKTLEDCELPPAAIVKPKAPPAKQAAE